MNNTIIPYYLDQNAFNEPVPVIAIIIIIILIIVTIIIGNRN